MLVGIITYSVTFFPGNVPHSAATAKRRRRRLQRGWEIPILIKVLEPASLSLMDKAKNRKRKVGLAASKTVLSALAYMKWDLFLVTIKILALFLGVFPEPLLLQVRWGGGEFDCAVGPPVRFASRGGNSWKKMKHRQKKTSWGAIKAAVCCPPPFPAFKLRAE